jgi:hypothetical protein
MYSPLHVVEPAADTSGQTQRPCITPTAFAGG